MSGGLFLTPPQVLTRHRVVSKLEVVGLCPRRSRFIRHGCFRGRPSSLGDGGGPVIWHRQRITGLVIAVALLGSTASGQEYKAQQAGKVPRIGYLAVLPRSAPLFQQNRQAFLEGMREHGYTEGQTIAIEWRFAEGRPERLPDLADELVRLKVNLIVAEATAASRAAKQATRTIPVVLIGAVDPVTEGLVTSLARPGGNVTGLSSMSPELMGKRLQLLKEVAPGMTRVAVLWQPDHYGEGTVKIMSEATESAARALAVRLQRVEARSADDLAGAFGAMTEGRADALLV
jgi:ABC-type uncharacterized transport system substrate-binding protein